MGTEDIKDANQIKKDYLKMYRKIYNKLVALSQQVKAMREVRESPKAIEYSDMPKGCGVGSDLSDYISDLDEMIIKINVTIKKLRKAKLQIEQVVFDLTDGVESRLIQMRYIEFRSWQDIADELGYSRMQICRIHGKALSHIELPEKCDIGK